MKGLTDLNSVVMCAINGMQAGDTKQEAVQSITSFVEGSYINKKTVQDLGNVSIEDVEKLHEMGFEFNINDGRVTGLILIGSCRM